MSKSKLEQLKAKAAAKAAATVDPSDQHEDSEDALEAKLQSTPSNLGTNSQVLVGSDTPVNCVPSTSMAAHEATPDEVSTELDYDKEVTVTVGDLLDMHRMLSFCMRGNQRPAIVKLQNHVVELLPEGTPLIHREPIK